MSTLAILALIFGIVGTAASVGLGAAQNKTNKELTEQTNESNLQAVRETNQSNVEQAELAYQRSLPTAQVRNLMSAGMSKPAALASLSGGGTYTAPVLQSAHSEAPQMDYSSIISSIERLENIPSSMAQHELQQEQLNALKVDTANKLAREQREKELHEFDVWSRMYGKESATKLDAASNLILNKLQDSGREVSSFKSFEDLIRSLGIQDAKELRDLPSIARQQLYSMVKERFEESRSQRDLELREQEQKNRNKASDDAHTRLMDDLKNSEFSRTLSAKQRAKVEAETEAIWQTVDEFDKDSQARDYERTLRENRARLENLFAEYNISKEELVKSIKYDKDGLPVTTDGASHYFKEIWKFIGAMFGLEYLGDLLRGIIAVAPK